MEENSSQSNKYDAALAKYNTNLSDADTVSYTHLTLPTIA